MADTSLHIFCEEGIAPTDAPAALRGRTSYSGAWRSSALWARFGAVGLVVSLIAVVAAKQNVTIVSAVPIAALIPAGLVDLVERRLPNRMVGWAAAAMLLVIAASLLGLGSSLPDGWLGDLAVGAGFVAGPLLVMHLVSPASMGFGDVKVGVVLGASLGVVDPQLAMVALFVASGGSAVVGLATRRRHLAFGPGLIVGAVVALATGAVS